ncbi:MAG: hypothetical protein ACE5EH_02175 [Gammaproteobacteria bacterium]
MILDCGCPSEFPDWHNEDVDLSGQVVHTLPLPCFFHMPVGYDNYVKRQQSYIDQLEIRERWPGFVISTTGMFRGKILRLLEDTHSMSRHVRTIQGPFKLRAIRHKGNISTIKGPIRQLQMELLDSGLMPKELYMCHLTCPRCRDKRGGDQILLLRKWEESEKLKQKISARQSS